jgi:(1->4)-alpha-D-glucan 1-alpha-D-glucosylmutase
VYGTREYEPLIASGTYGEDVVAFARDRLVTVAPRRIGGIGAGWAQTHLALPPGGWTDVMVDGPVRTGVVELRALFERFPVAVLERRDL